MTMWEAIGARRPELSVGGALPTTNEIHAIHAAASRGGKVSARVVLTYVLPQLDLWNWLTK